LVETNIRFEPLAYVIGNKGKSYSKQSITAEDRDGNIIRYKEQPAGRLRGEIATIYNRLPDGSTVFGPKRVEEILIDSGALPVGTPTMHYHALRTSNAHHDDPGALFVGAENISIEDVEATARAFMADGLDRLILAGDLQHGLHLGEFLSGCSGSAAPRRRARSTAPAGPMMRP
jgi:hypothetical protein